MLELEFLRKSTETRGSSEYCRMPRSELSAACFIKALISSLVVGFSTSATRSTIETLGVGTRNEMPSSLPLSSGSTMPMAFAAPVVVGMIDRYAARAPQILVRQIEQLLVVGVRVHRRHQAALDGEVVVQHFRYRRKAVGRARGIRDDV